MYTFKVMEDPITILTMLQIFRIRLLVIWLNGHISRHSDIIFTPYSSEGFPRGASFKTKSLKHTVRQLDAI